MLSPPEEPREEKGSAPRISVLKTVGKPLTIKKRSEFLRIGRVGSRAKTSNAIVVCARSLVPDSSMVGYTASKRVGNAVARNKAKRRLRSLVHCFESEFVPGVSFVFIATLDTAFGEFAKLKSDFLYCVRKAKERANAQ